VTSITLHVLSVAVGVDDAVVLDRDLQLRVGEVDAPEEPAVIVVDVLVEQRLRKPRELYETAQLRLPRRPGVLADQIGGAAKSADSCAATVPQLRPQLVGCCQGRLSDIASTVAGTPHPAEEVAECDEVHHGHAAHLGPARRGIRHAEPLDHDGSRDARVGAMTAYARRPNERTVAERVHVHREAGAVHRLARRLIDDQRQRSAPKSDSGGAAEELAGLQAWGVQPRLDAVLGGLLLEGIHLLRIEHDRLRSDAVERRGEIGTPQPRR
jgi:hypothetical protein